MAQAHTPGPWSVDLDDVSGNGSAPINSEGWIALARVVVRMEGDEANCDDGTANARLIAAAPDLLEAAAPFVGAAKSRAADAPEWRDTDTVSIVVTVGDLRAIAAASTKAKGGAE